MHIVKEKLGDQVFRPGFLFIAQILHIFPQGPRLGVAFRVAGAVQGKAGLACPDESHQAAGMGKVRAFGAGGRAVAAQRQHVAHADAFELVEDGCRARAVVAHADQVCKRRYSQLFLDEIRHFHSGDSARRAACAESHADKVGMQQAHRPQRCLQFFQLGGLFGRKALHRKHTAFCLEQFRDRHLRSPSCLLVPVRPPPAAARPQRTPAGRRFRM